VKSLHVPIGAEAPDFPLPTAAPPERLLSSLRGKAVVLIFYRGHWCQSCRRQLGQLATAYETIRSLDAELIAISADTQEDAPEPAVTRGWKFPVISDRRLTIIDQYGVRDEADPAGRLIAHPATFILDREGIVRFGHVGADRQDRPAVGAILLALESLAGASVF
jgi:peroxiredoxin